MSKSVLITGGLGYVGGRIARRLAQTDDISLRLGTRSIAVQYPEWLINGSIVTLDLSDDDSLSAACTGVDCVVHLAAMNEIDSAADPHEALIVNGLGTLKLLEAAERAGVQRFIYFSTAHVYGAPLIGEITERKLPRPIHPYAITHRIAEDFVLAAHDRKRLVGLVMRLSNSFGAPINSTVNRWTLIVNDLCRQAVVMRKMELRTAGLQRRDFITLEDVGRAVEHFLVLPAEACGDGLFNLGGEKSLQIIQLANLIAIRCEAVLGFIPPITHPDPSPNEADVSLTYRIDKIKTTGFVISGQIDAEIDATLQLCQSTFGAK